MNAKGVILKAFEQYRLKTCIDFTPWKGEENYISVFKGSGCSSSIGNRRVRKQRLSIGRYCDRLATVEHEFLHALGFLHEQSRADRDDYVNIILDQIEPGMVSLAHNFRKYDDKVSSSLGVPYDYGSVMHYGKRAFSIASKPTIVTKIPEFMDVIGQRIEISDSDLLKLNRLYNCTTSSTFVESCDFEELNICGMIQGPNNKWEQRMAVSAGPQTDFTSLGQCKGKGYFMHFSTACGCAGDSGFLESRFLYPKPGVQCLQFFLYSSGGANDSLKMWVREYDELNPQGRMTLFETITGSSGSWELHHVTLNITKKSRVVFEGVKGNASATLGGLSLDDVNIWSGQCPQHVWKIRNITSLLATTPAGTRMHSPSFLSPTGYSFQVGLYLNGRSTRPDTMALFLFLTSGPNDDSLKWPCPWHQATMSLMDQQSDVRTRMNMQRMVTTDPNKMDGLEFFWDRPSKVGSLVNGPDGSYYRGPGRGTSSFLTHSRLHSRKYIKGDDAYFLLSLQDITQLLLPQPLPSSAPHPKERALAPDVPLGANKGQNTLVMALTLTVSASLLLVALVSSMYVRRRLRTQWQQIDKAVLLEGMPGLLEQKA
ncbi:unnamed protein product [Gadus morhua 'NCC']